MDMLMSVGNGVLRRESNRVAVRKTKNPDVEQAALVGPLRNGRAVWDGEP